MRSLLDVKTEIAEIITSREDGMTKYQYARAKSRLAFLKVIEMYLENAPEELFISREIKRLENRISLICNNFNDSEYKDPKEARKKFEKEMGIPDLRTQLRALRFILK
jgi:hypothetical protein